MKKLIVKISQFFKKEIILDIALILALLSFFITKPSQDIFNAISWKTLILLFLLFSTLEGLKTFHVFDFIYRIVGKIKSTFLLSLFLTFLTFFLSLLVTNDVALLLIIPLTINILRTANKNKFIIPILSIETISANLGSILTPFGNPQNLFIYDKMGISGVSFIKIMAPIWALSICLLIVSLLLLFRKKFNDEIILKYEEDISWEGYSRALKIFYICLFCITLLTVLNLIPYQRIFLLFLLMLILFDRKTLKKVDYPLLITFLCFFIFSANIERNPKLASFLLKITEGHEYFLSLAFSQIISNVPTSILLEPYCINFKGLLYGVNIGGLGTIVASLASLITFRFYSKEEDSKKGKYLLTFTLYNVIFILALIPLGYFLQL